MREVLTFDDLKNRISELPLSEILEKYIPLHQVGRRTKAICPFHDDHNPSLSINDEKGLWYCFVDQVGGDAIKFVQLYKKISFKEALEDISEVLGWNFQDYIRKQKKNAKTEMAEKILSGAAKLYCEKGKSKKYWPLFEAFLKKRSLKKKTVEIYSLGLAPPRENIIVSFINSFSEGERDFALKVALELGIIREGKKGGPNTYYDQFRNRLIFPIWDSSGKVMGFIGRSLSLARKEREPKYLNSIDSFLFSKHNILYGLHLAKRTIRDRRALILVEGNMDQVALFQSGFQNTVAIMGTGLREKVVTRLLGFARTIYLCFDNDQGGMGVATRANKEFLKHGVIPYFIDLHPHKDPDDFIREEGALPFQKRIDEARPFLDIQIEKLFPETRPEIPERKLEILKNVFDILSPLKKSLSAQERILAFAKRLNLQSDRASIVGQYEDYLKTQGATRNIAKSASSPPPPSLLEQKRQKEEPLGPSQQGHHSSLTGAEKTLVRNLVQYPELLANNKILKKILDFPHSSEVGAYISRLKKLVTEEIGDKTGEEYLRRVQELLGSDKYSLDIAATTTEALLKHRGFSLNSMATQIAKDIERKLQKETLKMKKQNIKNQQSKAQTEKENQKLLTQLITIDRQLAALKRAPRRS